MQGVYKDFSSTFSKSILMMKNSYRPWSNQDIETLHLLVREGVSCETASKILGRTPKAIAHALKNSIYQQLLSHDPDDVAKYYKTENSVLEALVPEKYYKDVDNVEDTDGNSEEEVIVSSLGCCKPGTSAFVFPLVTMGIFGCMSYYLWILRDQWLSLM